MRVVAGRAKGRILYLPKGCAIRPTADVVKEALFSMLGSVAGLSCLDLFAGSGGVGIEALSRGAAKAVFIERDAVLVQAIKKNISVCGFCDGGEVIALDVLQGIDVIAKRNDRYDIIFADPPYDAGMVKRTLECLAGAGVIAPQGLTVFQHSVRERVPALDAMGLVLRDQRKYGDTYLSFLTLST